PATPDFTSGDDELDRIERAIAAAEAPSSDSTTTSSPSSGPSAAPATSTGSGSTVQREVAAPSATPASEPTQSPATGESLSADAVDLPLVRPPAAGTPPSSDSPQEGRDESDDSEQARIQRA